MNTRWVYSADGVPMLVIVTDTSLQAPPLKHYVSTRRVTGTITVRTWIGKPL